jgi:uncharacterized repeat protein (TIGR03803 family)
MRNNRQVTNLSFSAKSLTAALAIAVMSSLLLASTGSAQAQGVIYNFTGGADGAYPVAGLTVDAAGNLYGTTCGSFCGDGTGSNGTVFRLSPTRSRWVFTTLYRFQGGSDGSTPMSRVIFGPDGSLYGTTYWGGGYPCPAGNGCGTVFKLTPPARTSPTAMEGWTETVLYRFTGGSDGAYPYFGDLLFDQAGNLYGGTDTTGTVYKLTPASGGWTESVIYNFGTSVSGVIIDESGNLYGTAFGGYLPGEVFELLPSQSGWTRKTLYSFQGNGDGANPVGGVVFDPYSSAMLGTTSDDSPDGSGAGTLFSLGSQFRSLQHFTGNLLGSYYSGPRASLTARQSAYDYAWQDYFGTTCEDGRYGYGSIFSWAWTCEGCYCYQAFRTLYDFAGGSDGAYFYGGVAFDANNYYAYVAALYGGSHGLGTVFSMYVPKSDQIIQDKCK